MKYVSASAYTQILSGSMMRLVLQAVYFGMLVNVLPLADYGVFASVLALSLILSAGGAFGFTAPLFRAATTRRRLIGFYVSAFIVFSCGETCVELLVASIIYHFTFSTYLGFISFLFIFLSESALWRLLDALASLNTGMGKYRNGTLAGILGSSGRLLAVVLFIMLGGGALGRWAIFYGSANLLTTVVAVYLFWPRIRLRWHFGIIRKRLRESVSFLTINTLQALQIEADKLLVLALAGQEQAGIYALSMRLIELLLVPIKSFFPPYVQTLLRTRGRLNDGRLHRKVEVLLGTSAALLFCAASVGFALFPTLFGNNIAHAAHWFRLLPLVPIYRALIDYHRELMFAADRLTTFAVVAATLASVRLGTIAAVLMMTGTIDALVLPLNAVAFTLYALSASIVWRVAIKPPLNAAGRRMQVKGGESSLARMGSANIRDADLA